MIYYRYGVQLQKMQEQHLELVRQWRNSDFVRTRMQFKKLITPEEQAAWFAQLHQRNNWYFVASDKNLFGVFHIKNIDWKKRSGEAGAFVGNAHYIGHITPAFAILTLMDFGFFVLGLKHLEAKYHPDFKEIAQLNHQLGYKVYQQETDGFVRAFITTEQYLKKAARFRKMAENIQGPESYLVDEDLWLAKRIKRLHQRLLS